MSTKSSPHGQIDQPLDTTDRALVALVRLLARGAARESLADPAGLAASVAPTDLDTDPTTSSTSTAGDAEEQRD